MSKSTVFHAFVLLTAVGIYQHDITVTATVVGQEKCLCNALFDLLVDAKAQWLNNMKKVSELEGKVQKLEKQVETWTRPHVKIDISGPLRNAMELWESHFSGVLIGCNFDLRVRKCGMSLRKTEFLNPSIVIRKGQTCNLPIAFFARRTINTLVASEQTVDFADVVTDTCKTFNTNTSVFTCPTPGVYVFHVVLLDQADNRLNHIELVKNGQRVAITWSKGKNGDHQMSGNTAILNLAKGDTVYVRVAKNYPSQPHQIYSTFSGFKVY